MFQTILFDLDGTLTDSGEGIMNCAEAAIRHFRLPIPPREQLRCLVGPPLEDFLPRFGIPKEQVYDAIEVFRERYTRVGKFENTPYPGIETLLHTLKSRGCRLLVATSKPEPMAVEILEHFGLACYFDRICGAALDHSRSTKEQVLRYLLEQECPVETPVMVGDTIYDALGAAVFHIPAIGVSWGYGDEEEMKKNGVIGVAHTYKELLTLLENG